MDIKASGVEPGHRQPNGVQTTGRDYRALSEVEFGIRRTNDVEIVVRDGVTLLADLFQPDAEGRFPALLSFSCYPRQIQDVGAPIGFVEAGASDFFTPRGYAHLIANARGTGGSGGVTSFLDSTRARRPLRCRRVDRRPALVRWQCGHARHQLFRHDPTGCRRRTAPGPRRSRRYSRSPLPMTFTGPCGTTVFSTPVSSLPGFPPWA